jgi:catechol 2,3-dioxygenase-like lactoylglutathione lyase family enzyme
MGECPFRPVSSTWLPMQREVFMGVVALDHVQLAAPRGCEAEARWFFGELLGLAEIEKPQPLRGRGGVWFAVGQQQLHIGVAERFVPASKAHAALRVEAGKLDEFANRLTSGGLEVRWDHALEDVRRFYVDDSWGNRIELLAAK